MELARPCSRSALGPHACSRSAPARWPQQATSIPGPNSRTAAQDQLGITQRAGAGGLVNRSAGAPENRGRLVLAASFMRGPPSSSPGLPGRPRGPQQVARQMNTAQVHGAMQGEEVDVEAEAGSLLVEYTEAAVQAVSSRPGRAPDSGARALALLRLLLPDFDTAAAGVAQTDVRLRAVADRLSRLSMAGLSRQESSIMGLFSGVLARGAAEPEERAARNGIVRLVWDLFADARVEGRVDSSITGPALRELQQYRTAYRKKTVEALEALLEVAAADGAAVANKVVVLRTALPGDLAAQLLSTPALLQADVAVLQAAAQALKAQPAEGGTASWELTRLLQFIEESKAGAADEGAGGSGS